MNQTIRHLKALASGMGITLPKLIRRRRSRQDVVACVDESGTVRLKSRLYVDPDLPGWQPKFNTICR